MNCSNWHSTRRDRKCPYCIVRILFLKLEKLDPNAPELTPAAVLLRDAEDEREKAGQCG
jgi:hypothetical protein